MKSNNADEGDGSARPDSIDKSQHITSQNAGLEKTTAAKLENVTGTPSGSIVAQERGGLKTELESAEVGGMSSNDDNVKADWTCAVCTFANTAIKLACDMCATERPCSGLIPEFLLKEAALTERKPAAPSEAAPNTEQSPPTPPEGGKHGNNGNGGNWPLPNILTAEGGFQPLPDQLGGFVGDQYKNAVAQVFDKIIPDSMTFECLELVSDQICEMKIENLEMLQQLTTLIIDKAATKPAVCHLYASLCAKMHKKFSETWWEFIKPIANDGKFYWVCEHNCNVGNVAGWLRQSSAWVAHVHAWAYIFIRAFVCGLQSRQWQLFNSFSLCFVLVDSRTVPFPRCRYSSRLR
jgi:hypothetical protein